MHNRFNSNRRRGFTLIEVLVVVAIVALLVSILLPALSRAREHARSATCSTHLREIGTGMGVFVSENKSLIPRGASNRTKYTWVQWVARMFGDKRAYHQRYNDVPVEKMAILQCPSRAQTHATPFLDYVNNGLDHRGPLDDRGVFSASGRWIGVNGFAKVDLWKQPGSTIYAGDAAHETEENRISLCLRNTRVNIASIRAAGLVSNQGFQMFKPWAAYTLPCYPEDVEKNGRDPRAALRMHLNAGSNAVFVDGHCELVKPPPRQAADQVSQYYMKKWGVLHASTAKIPGGQTPSHSNESLGLGDEDYVPY